MLGYATWFPIGLRNLENPSDRAVEHPHFVAAVKPSKKDNEYKLIVFSVTTNKNFSSICEITPKDGWVTETSYVVFNPTKTNWTKKEWEEVEELGFSRSMQPVPSHVLKRIQGWAIDERNNGIKRDIREIFQNSPKNGWEL